MSAIYVRKHSTKYTVLPTIVRIQKKSYFLSLYLSEATSHGVQISVISTLLEIKTKVGNTDYPKKWQGVSTVTCDVANTSQKQIFIRVYYCP